MEQLHAPLNQIQPNPYQPRVAEDAAAIAETKRMGIPMPKRLMERAREFDAQIQAVSAETEAADD